MQYNLGQISLIYSDIETAEKYFTECLFSNELEPRAYFELSKIYMLKGEKDKSIIFANKAIETDISFKKKVLEEPILIPIKPYIVVNKEHQEKQEKKKMSEKIESNIEYLEKTYRVVENLNIREIGKQTRQKQMKKENEKTIENKI